jgi:hypothetical protein
MSIKGPEIKKENILVLQDELFNTDSMPTGL